MECPVCQHQHVAEDATHCPECNSELSGFEFIKQSKSERRIRKRYLFSLSGIAILLFSGWVVSSTIPEGTERQELETQVTGPTSEEILEAKIEELRTTISEQQKEIERLETVVHDYQALDLEMQEGDNNYSVHVVKEGESLWSISEMYHGHGHEHDNIADHNEVNNPHHIKPGDTVVIKH
ncbi:LysM peptidoglycan-binding domain-containing protein [bacterium SCSIO 12741]|nr:LysM peptidoglycan-binding domain-containing protein [bacterium SCSIO 12741]